MAGLTTRTYKDSYKNIVIIGDGSWNGVPSTFTYLKDGAGVSLALAVSADALKVRSGKKLYFGDGGVHILNPDANTIKLVAPKINLDGKVIFEAGNPISAVSAVITDGTFNKIGGNTISGFTMIKGTTVSGTTLKSGGTKITTAGVSATAASFGTINVGANGIKMTDGGKMLARGGTGIDSPDNGELQFNIASLGFAIMDSDEFYPKTNEGPTLGRAGYRWNALYSKNVYCNGITASTVDLKNGTYKGSLASVTSMKASTGNVSTMTNKTFNGTNVNGTLAKFTTVSAATAKGTTGSFETVIGGDMIITSGKFSFDTIPNSSSGLSTGAVYASSTGVLMIVQ